MSFKRIIPLLDRVLIEKIQPRTKTVGGILLPESASAKVRSSSNISVNFFTILLWTSSAFASLVPSILRACRLR